MKINISVRKQANFNKIVRQYKRAASDNVLRIYSLVPTLIHFWGGVKNKKVLDLACGYGFYTRLVRRRGAAEVTGADISKEAITLAKKEEKSSPLGIKYFVYDAKKLSKIGNFDLITATFILCFAESKKALLAMCKSIYGNLDKGGRFITIDNNPSAPLKPGKKYNLSVTAGEPLEEGDELIVSLFKNGKRICSFKNYFWKKKTYEAALKKAGFRTVKWHKPIVSEEGLNKFGRGFWKEYLTRLPFSLIECFK